MFERGMKSFRGLWGNLEGGEGGAFRLRVVGERFWRL
jgi:hypothetical protein